MLTTQLILLVVFGVIVIAWGARLDINNHRKEKKLSEQRAMLSTNPVS